MTERIIRIATRRSALALWQANHVAALLEAKIPQIKTELVEMSTRGDKILDAPLAKVGGKGLFVKELEQAMLEDRADIAVHSMKDVPVEFPDDLQLTAILERENPSDAFVSVRYSRINELPATAIIGTSSLRRQCQILAKHPHFTIKSLRGNVNTRMAKLDEGQYDAIILATAGLNRLGWQQRITRELPTELSLPAIGQGAIGIESRSTDSELNAWLQHLNDQDTATCVSAERALNNGLNGGCQVPIAGFAELDDSGHITLRGLVGSPDGKTMLKDQVAGPRANAEQLGQQLAQQLLAQGADKILQQLYTE